MPNLSGGEEQARIIARHLFGSSRRSQVFINFLGDPFIHNLESQENHHLPPELLLAPILYSTASGVSRS